MKMWPLFLLPFLLLVSCGSHTPQARINGNPALFEKLSAREQQLVSRGEIARGMSTEAVWLAWGTPADKFVGQQANKTQERWVYTRSEPTYTTWLSSSYGYRYGPYSRYGWTSYGLGPEVVYTPQVSSSVTFINQRVDSWERKR